MNYELTTDTKIDIDGTILYRIIATKDFRDVKKGDLGGWVSKSARILDKAWVYDNAVLKDKAIIRDKVKVKDNAVVKDDAVVNNRAIIQDDAIIRDKAKIRDNAIIGDSSVIRDNALVSGKSIVRDNAIVKDHSWIRDNAKVRDNAIISHRAVISGHSVIMGDAVIENMIPSILVYAYHANPIPSKEGNLIRLGCFVKSRDEWIRDFWDNERGFPRNSHESKDRLKALNMCLVWYGEDLIKYEDLL